MTKENANHKQKEYKVWGKGDWIAFIIQRTFFILFVAVMLGGALGFNKKNSGTILTISLVFFIAFVIEGAARYEVNKRRKGQVGFHKDTPVCESCGRRLKDWSTICPYCNEPLPPQPEVIFRPIELEEE